MQTAPLTRRTVLFILQKWFILNYTFFVILFMEELDECIKTPLCTCSFSTTINSNIWKRMDKRKKNIHLRNAGSDFSFNVTNCKHFLCIWSAANQVHDFTFCEVDNLLSWAEVRIPSQIVYFQTSNTVYFKQWISYLISFYNLE